MSPDDQRDEARPEYTVYRSRRGPLKQLRSADLGELRERLRRSRKRDRRRDIGRPGGRRPRWRRGLRYALIGAGIWLLLSVVLFAISAQIQQARLDSAAGDRVGAITPLAAFPQTILVIGTDSRPEARGQAAAETRQRCTEQAATGSPPDGDCPGFRADTLMLIRAGGATFRRLSIPRDTRAEIPGRGVAKINAAYAFGGAALQIETVELLLGIEVDHVVVLDFEGFAQLIDSLGGVRVTPRERIRCKPDGGAREGGITLKLDRGRTVTLDGHRALAYSRIRNNPESRCRGNIGDDLARARRQQQVLEGIKGRLTSPWRAPMNFLRGPLIAWNAPKATVSDMGALTLPQLGPALAIGSGDERILGRRGATFAGGDIVVSQQECRRAARQLLGKPPPRPPRCSPGV